LIHIKGSAAALKYSGVGSPLENRTALLRGAGWAPPARLFWGDTVKFTLSPQLFFCSPVIHAPSPFASAAADFIKIGSAAFN
jgi:hypothetical protein